MQYIMKRYILYAMSLVLLCSCTVESAERSGYSEASLQRFASEVAEDKLIFPMSIFETVLLIDEYERMSKATNPYGDGFASKRIADIICSFI